MRDSTATGAMGKLEWIDHGRKEAERGRQAELRRGEGKTVLGLETWPAKRGTSEGSAWVSTSENRVHCHERVNCIQRASVPACLSCLLFVPPEYAVRAPSSGIDWMTRPHLSFEKGGWGTVLVLAFPRVCERACRQWTVDARIANSEAGAGGPWRSCQKLGSLGGALPRWASCLLTLPRTEALRGGRHDQTLSRSLDIR